MAIQIRVDYITNPASKKSQNTSKTTKEEIIELKVRNLYISINILYLHSRRSQVIWKQLNPFRHCISFVVPERAGLARVN